jgi:hypothetical protein
MSPVAVDCSGSSEHPLLIQWLETRVKTSYCSSVPCLHQGTGSQSENNLLKWACVIYGYLYFLHENKGILFIILGSHNCVQKFRALPNGNLTRLSKKSEKTESCHPIVCSENWEASHPLKRGGDNSHVLSIRFSLFF